MFEDDKCLDLIAPAKLKPIAQKVASILKIDQTQATDLLEQILKVNKIYDEAEDKIESDMQEDDYAIPSMRYYSED